VGPLSVNKDLVTRFSTSLNSNMTLFTDDNCLEKQQRVYDGTRPDPIAGNYYPITCSAFLTDVDSNVQFSILTDRTMGGGSLKNGQIEVMLHRRIITTDHYGPLDLDDTDHLENVRFYLVFDKAPIATPLRRRLQHQMQFPPTLSFASFPSFQKWKYKTSFSPLKQPLPDNVHLMTYKYQSSNSSKLTFRLLNIFEEDDQTPLAQPVTINLLKYFTFPPNVQFEERSLSTVVKKKMI